MGETSRFGALLDGIHAGLITKPIPYPHRDLPYHRPLSGSRGKAKYHEHHARERT